MRELTGVGGLIRLILRRDRVLTPLWVLFVGLVPVSYVAAIDGLFPTEAGRRAYAAASGHNGGFVALYGPLHGSSLGELVAWRAGFIPIVIGLFSILTVIRHTRTEEEAGRRELLGSTVMGRHAGLAAALAVTMAADLVLGAILAGGLVGQGLPATGSWALGLGFAACGWVYAAVAAVAAQLTGGAGGARGIAIGLLGATFVLRVTGDLSGLSSDGTLTWASWLSPIGWAHRVRPYAGEAWWPLALAAGVAALLVAVAVALSARRDIGAGLLPQRLGPASAGAGLRSPLGLAWRLHRSLLAGWTAGFLALGVVLGYLAAGIGDLVRDAPAMSDIMIRIGGVRGLVDSYFSGLVALFGLLAAGYAIQATLRAREEESSGRAEPVLGTAVGRVRWAAGHLAFSLLGPAVALAAAGLAMGLTHGLNTGDVGRELPRVLGAAMVQLPAVWVLGAVAVLLFGLLPRLAAVSWGALAICLLIGLVGPALRVDERLLEVSPFTHLPRLPGGPMNVTPLLWLAVVAAVLAGAGLAALRRRDIPAA
ncbi:ABC transporter permease [Sphaerisporangium rhizosphaerae]|uniref:ABC transporter permease n=1 Tax=Sphaerisporangium rhizosphaerae TaxID=2269375 RepID=A0ABW2PA73_9ACTN